MNKFIGIGRLIRDPEVRYSQAENSMAIARYTIAIDRRKTANQQENTADFIPCVAFGKNAEFAEKYLAKGIKMVITGRIQTGSYTNKDGQKVYTTEIMVEEQEFAESKSKSGREEPSARESSNDGFMNIPSGLDSEELPFN